MIEHNHFQNFITYHLIVPGKFESMQYVREHLGFAAEEVVCCGDSGNDKSMLDPTNFSKSIESLNEISHIGVVVANAQPDLMEWALAQSKELEAVWNPQE